MFLRVISFLWIAAMLSVSPAKAESPQADQYVNGLIEEVLQVIKSDRTEDNKLTTLNGIFRNNVDTNWIGRFVLGKHWRTANEAQRAEYLKYYAGFLANTYTKRFTEYTNEKVDVLGTKTIGKGEYETSVQLVSADSAPVSMQYKLRKSGSNFKVFDIIVEGVSLISTQRSEFGSVVERKGMDQLIAALKKRAEA